MASANRKRRLNADAETHNAVAPLFLAPWLIGLVVLTSGPMLASLYLSFTSYDLFTPPNWVGFDNYIRLFGADPRYIKSILVTTIYVLCSVPLKLGFALVLALVLNRALAGVGIYRSIFYLPSLLGGSVAIAVMWRQIFAYDGVINDLLWEFFGFEGPSWISNPSYSLMTLVALSVWQFGSPMVIFLAGLKQIPRDYYEAAAIDGASPARQFFSITLPLLTPVIFFNLVMQIIGAFQAFTSSFIVSDGTGGPADSTLFYTLYLYEKGFTDFEMGYASAIAWILVAIISTATAISFLTSKYWVHYGDLR